MEKLPSAVTKLEKAGILDMVYARIAIRKIRNAVMDIEVPRLIDNLDFCVRQSRDVSAVLEEYRKRYGYSPHLIPRTNVSLWKSSDEVGLFYGSSNGLEYRSHRFRFNFNSGGGVQYHREAYNVDFQAMGSQPVNLASLKEIASHSQAIIELRWLASQIAGKPPNSWRDGPPISTVAC